MKRRPLRPATAFDRVESFAAEPAGDTTLERLFADDLAAHADRSGFRLLAIGTEAFLMRTSLADAAQRSLDLQYYIYRDDDTGALLTQALLKAADRGVRVRLLVDDLNILRKDDDVTALDAHPRIEVRIFNPFATRGDASLARLASFVSDPARLNRRMHNKSFIADNLCAIVGGRNIGDEYFDAGRDFGFGDLDVLAVGPVTRKISQSFDQYWNSAYAYPLSAMGMRAKAALWMERVRLRLGRHFIRMRKSDYASSLRKTDLAAQLSERHLALEWANATLIADLPGKIMQAPESASTLPYDRLRELAEHASEEIILVSPYFVPGEEGVAALRQIRSRNVRVRVLTNSLASSDVAAVHAGYSRYRGTLLAMGVELYELKPIVPAGRRRKRKIMFGSARASLHAKTYVFDRRRVVIGSMNLDPRSMYLNTELGLMIESEALCADIAESFDELVGPDYSYRVELADEHGALRWSGEDKGVKVVYSHDPQASIWRRLAVKVLGMLPIERQL
ncbi:MAG TPA: phospholipase D family protein [Burkholderiales bacterium]